MTLGEAIRDAQQWLQEEQSTPGGGSPFSWPDLVVKATDTLCQDTDCLVVVFNRLITHGGLPLPPFVFPDGVRPANKRHVLAPGGQVDYHIGFRVPGKAWEVDAVSGVALPLTGDSVCPVPDWATAAIPIRAALQRCIQFPSPENKERKADLAAEYRTVSGNIAKQAQAEYRNLIARLKD